MRVPIDTTKKRYSNSFHNKGLSKQDMAKVMDLRKNCLGAVEQVLQEFDELHKETDIEKSMAISDIQKILKESQV